MKQKKLFVEVTVCTRGHPEIHFLMGAEQSSPSLDVRFGPKPIPVTKSLLDKVDAPLQAFTKTVPLGSPPVASFGGGQCLNLQGQMVAVLFAVRTLPGTRIGWRTEAPAISSDAVVVDEIESTAGGFAALDKSQLHKCQFQVAPSNGSYTGLEDSQPGAHHVSPFTTYGLAVRTFPTREEAIRSMVSSSVRTEPFSRPSFEPPILPIVPALPLLNFRITPSMFPNFPPPP